MAGFASPSGTGFWLVVTIPFYRKFGQTGLTISKWNMAVRQYRRNCPTRRKGQVRRLRRGSGRCEWALPCRGQQL